MTSISKKVCLLGEFAVGKTSLMRRFVYDLFDDRYLSTIGVKVSRKFVAVPLADQVAEVTLLLWDLASSEGFDAMRGSYLRGAAGAVLVCDLTRASTLRSLPEYAGDLRKVNPNALMVIAANKQDLVAQHAVSSEEIQALAAELNAPCYLTSAKTGEEVDALFRGLSRRLVGAG